MAGDINWSQVAADDVSFVMLGTRSKGAVDPYFHRNIQQASAAGVKVGVYIYSLAMTPEMAVEEANFVLNLIHDYPVSYPVAFDMEDSTQEPFPRMSWPPSPTRSAVGFQRRAIIRSSMPMTTGLPISWI